MSWLEIWLRRFSDDDAPYERELLANALAVLGEYAFETHRRRAETTRRLFTQLSNQVREADFSAILPTLREQRQDEQQLVNGHLNDLRDMVWHLLNAMSQMAQEEAQDDALIHQQVRQLSQQAQSPDALDIHALRQTLHSITQVIEKRERRHRETLQQLQGQVHHLMRELEQARRESTTDALTGLYNRRAFENCLQHTVAVNRLFQYPAALLLIDIDHFKQVNDTYGHAAGDEALKATAERIVRVCKRKSDFVARYGGEEFAVILRETSLRDAQKIAQQIADAARREPVNLPEGQSIRITVSIGVAELRPHETPEAWFQRADALLYQAKQAGRDQVAA
ncbi:MAG: GGDEF domain-containing protein [Fimbriimonadales bacterium]|nr:GGDEF domain-containing protein [Fimbriimonadales bacterium]